MKRLFIILALMPWSVEAKSFTPREVSLVLDRVGSEASDEFRKLMQSQYLRKTEGMVSINIVKPVKLSMEKYSHFTEPYAIRLARKFKRRWRTVLRKAEKKFGVDREVIVAILLVETSFGRFTGNHNPLSVFASIYVDVHQFQSRDEYKDLDKKLRERFIRKQTWALKELKAISRLTEVYPKLNILEIKGSYAGAFGKAQFLPSSFLAYAVPYTKGMTPNLHLEQDAIFSVGNYLKNNGYRGGMDSKGSYASIFHYNNSDVYVKTVLNVAKAIK